MQPPFQGAISAPNTPNGQSKATIRCNGCGQPYTATIRNVIDVARDPQGKALLLAGQLNTSQCPNCGAVNALSAPLMYHDASKELLVALVPMELNLNKDQQERVVGDLMKALPKENFKGYMFNPKRALTMQGLIDLVLQADGITPEMMEAQKQRVNLIQQFIEAAEDALPALIQTHDAQIDIAFLQTVGLMVQRLAQSGRPDIAERLIEVQQVVLDHSTFGKTMLEQQAAQDAMVEAVAQEVEALGQEADRGDFLALARKYAGDNLRLQALVGLVRPVFDAQFFQELTVVIAQEPAVERPKLEALRDKLIELTQIIDQQTQRQVQVAVSLLQSLVNGKPEELDAMIIQSLPMINDTFMAVLTTNIQEAEKRRDLMTSVRLKEIYEKVMTLLQQQMQPELVFVNQLLSLEDEAQAKQFLAQGVQQFGETLLEVMDAVGEVLHQQGDAELAQRLVGYRRAAAALVSAS